MAQHPSADFQTYLLWLEHHHLNSRLPASNQTVQSQIQKVNFEDAGGLTPRFIENIPSSGALPSRKAYCGGYLYYCVPDCQLLGESLLADVQPPEYPSTWTLLETLPPVPGIPHTFFELGILFKADSATSTLESAMETEWVLVVTPDRAVYAVWNSNHDERRRLDISTVVEVEPELWKTRATGGLFPGFEEGCTMVALSADVGELFNAEVPIEERRLLVGRTTSLYTLPEGTKLRFTVEEEGPVYLEPIERQRRAHRIALDQK